MQNADCADRASTRKRTPKFYGGTERVISWLISGLAKRGHDNPVCERRLIDASVTYSGMAARASAWSPQARADASDQPTGHQSGRRNHRLGMAHRARTVRPALFWSL